jgi:hypothetical protein
MAFVNVTNWFLQRTAGVLFDLQKTPYDKTVNGIDANPKKTPANNIVSWSREFYTNWPADTVFKISGAPSGAVINKLELETTSTFNSVKAEVENLVDLWDAVYFARGAPPIFDSVNWTGGTNEAYDSVDVVFNLYEPFEDPPGTMNDAWRIESYTASWNSAGQAVESNFQVVYQALAPNTLGTGAVPCSMNGIGTAFFSDPNNSVWAKFSGITNAKDFMDEHPGTTVNIPMAAFCMRSDADSAHTLTPYVQGGLHSNFGGFSSSNTGVGNSNNIFSYRHSTSDKAMGYFQKHDTTCKWYYTPNACEDCWYEGKIIKVRVSYKKAPITYTYNTNPTYVFYFENLWTIGTWASHSTEDYDLTIPAGYTRQQLGSTFTVPVVDGYIVTIDDIKFISVT